MAQGRKCFGGAARKGGVAKRTGYSISTGTQIAVHVRRGIIEEVELGVAVWQFQSTRGNLIHLRCTQLDGHTFSGIFIGYDGIFIGYDGA